MPKTRNGKFLMFVLAFVSQCVLALVGAWAFSMDRRVTNIELRQATSEQRSAVIEQRLVGIDDKLDMLLKAHGIRYPDKVVEKAK